MQPRDGVDPRHGLPPDSSGVVARHVDAVSGRVTRDVSSVIAGWLLDCALLRLLAGLVLASTISLRIGILVAAGLAALLLARYSRSSMVYDRSRHIYIVRNPFRTHVFDADRVLARGSHRSVFDRSNSNRRLLLRLAGRRRYGLRPRGWLRVVALNADMVVLVPGLGLLPDSGPVRPLRRLVGRG